MFIKLIIYAVIIIWVKRNKRWYCFTCKLQWILCIGTFFSFLEICKKNVGRSMVFMLVFWVLNFCISQWGLSLDVVTEETMHMKVSEPTRWLLFISFESTVNYGLYTETEREGENNCLNRAFVDYNYSVSTIMNMSFNDLLLYGRRLSECKMSQIFWRTLGQIQNWCSLNEKFHKSKWWTDTIPLRETLY